jgi:hypothetical protein
LKPNASLGIADQRFHAFRHNCGPICPFGDEQPLPADVRIGVRQGRLQVRFLDHPEACQELQCMAAGLRRAAAAGQFAQLRRDGPLLALQQQPVGRLALPGIGMFQQRNELSACSPT